MFFGFVNSINILSQEKETKLFRSLKLENDKQCFCNLPKNSSNEVEVRYINELKPQNDISLMNSNFTQLTKFCFFIFNNSKEKLIANLN